jgi:hypothetical protein
VVLEEWTLSGNLPVQLGSRHVGGRHFHLASWGSTFLAGPTIGHWPALWISLGLILTSLLAAWAVFRLQEL